MSTLPRQTKQPPFCNCLNRPFSWRTGEDAAPAMRPMRKSGHGLFAGLKHFLFLALSLGLASASAISSAFAACPVNYPLPDEQLIPTAIYLKKDANNLYWKAVYANLNRDAIDCPTSSNEVSNNGPTFILGGLAPQSANNSAVISRVWKWVCSGYCTNAGGMNGELVIQKEEQTPALVQGNEIIGQISLTAMANAGIRLPADFSTVQPGYLFYVDGVQHPTRATPYGAIDANLFKSPATLTSEWQQIYPFAFSISASSQQAQAGQPFTLTASNGALGSCTSSNPAIIPNPTVAAGGASATSLVAATVDAESRVTISCASTNTKTADITVTVAATPKGEACNAAIQGNQIVVPYVIYYANEKLNYVTATFTPISEFDGDEPRFNLTRVVAAKERNCADAAFIGDSKTLVVPLGGQVWAGLVMESDRNDKPIFSMVRVDSPDPNSFAMVPAAAAAVMCATGMTADLALNLLGSYTKYTYPYSFEFTPHTPSDAEITEWLESAGVACITAATPITKIPYVGKATLAAVKKLQSVVDKIREFGVAKLPLIKQSLAMLSRNIQDIWYASDPAWYKINKVKTLAKKAAQDIWDNIGVVKLIKEATYNNGE